MEDSSNLNKKPFSSKVINFTLILAGAIIAAYFNLIGKGSIPWLVFLVTFIFIGYRQFQYTDISTWFKKSRVFLNAFGVVGMTFLFLSNSTKIILTKVYHIQERPPVCDGLIAKQTLSELLKEGVKDYPEITGYSIKEVSLLNYNEEVNEYQCEATIVPNKSMLSQDTSEDILTSKAERELEKTVRETALRMMEKILKYKTSVDPEDKKSFYVEIGS